MLSSIGKVKAIWIEELCEKPAIEANTLNVPDFNCLLDNGQKL